MSPELQILLVEDSPADVLIVERALHERGARHRLEWSADGRAALERLRSGRDRVDLVLLDLNLPGVDGLEVLGAIRADPALRPLPVVVLSSSRRDEDVARAYQAGANTCVQKPAEFGPYCDLLATLLHYWSEVALRLPRD